MIAAALTGYGTSLALILAIGAQNAFVLRQGLMRSHVPVVCLICAASDAVLIAAGVLGFGAAVTAWPWLPAVMTWAGAAFLAAYGAVRLRAAWRGAGALDPAGPAQPLPTAVLLALGFTWANPHVYLDTLGLVGAVSTGFQGGAKAAFALGAIAASFSFFFTLGYGARLVAPFLSSPRAWSRLDAGVGALMWALAASLVWPGRG